MREVGGETRVVLGMLRELLETKMESPSPRGGAAERDHQLYEQGRREGLAQGIRAINRVIGEPK